MTQRCLSNLVSQRQRQSIRCPEPGSSPVSWLHAARAAFVRLLFQPPPPLSLPQTLVSNPLPVEAFAFFFLPSPSAPALVLGLNTQPTECVGHLANAPDCRLSLYHCTINHRHHHQQHQLLLDFLYTSRFACTYPSILPLSPSGSPVALNEGNRNLGTH